VWVVNIEANPDCRVTVKGRTRDMRARKLEGEERAEAWELMIRTWPNYRLYEQRTESRRTIKVFELTPR
jgi:deazaflavin-dependent oxidoreductase (nitroreductase family)